MKLQLRRVMEEIINAPCLGQYRDRDDLTGLLSHFWEIIQLKTVDSDFNLNK